MIGYDIDGVFVPDIQHFDEDGLPELLKTRTYNLVPIFEPDGEYVMITGRPSSDLVDTLFWIDRFFVNKPVNLFHENEHLDTSKEYKLQVLLDNPEITTFIESDLYQASYLARHAPNVNIIHFGSYIEKAFSF